MVVFFHDLVAINKLYRLSKMNFQGREIFKRFSIDRLSQMTPALDNSLFSQKEDF